MRSLEQLRMERLESMLEWRLSKGRSPLQQMEAEALGWALELIREMKDQNQNGGRNGNVPSD